TAGEHRGVVHRGFLRGHRVEVERAQGDTLVVRRQAPETVGVTGKTRDRSRRAGIPVVVVVAIGRHAQLVAADLVAGEDHATAGLGRATHQAATVRGDAEDGRNVFQVATLGLGLAVAVAQLGAVEVL